MKSTILFIPEKLDTEREKVAKAWKEQGGIVRRIGKFWIKPETNGKNIAIYGFDSFCLVLAETLGVSLEMPKDEWIAMVDKKFTKRKLEIVPIQDAREIDFPKFIKPVIPKLFAAQVFDSYSKLLETIEGIEEKEKLIVSDIIEVKKEIRSFILNKKIIDLAYYEGKGLLEEARNFINQFLKETELDLPTTFVLDIGYFENGGWCIIEFNSTWGAGLNFCDPIKVIDCIKAATIN